LYLFEGNFPAFLPQAVRAIMEHPNLTQSDYQKMDTFSKMFELDWRGDRSIANKADFLSLKPVYLNKNDSQNTSGYGIIGNYELLAMLR